MGLKLELILSVAILGTVVSMLHIDLKDRVTQKKPSTKELDFTYTTFVEVDTQRIQSSAFSKSGRRDQGVLSLYTLQYQAKSLDFLESAYGRYQNNYLYLEDDVKFYQNGGFRYYTDYAVYNQEREILKIPNKFVGIMQKNVIHGERLRYNMRKKEVTADAIRAVLYFNK